MCFGILIKKTSAYWLNQKQKRKIQNCRIRTRSSDLARSRPMPASNERGLYAQLRGSVYACRILPTPKNNSPSTRWNWMTFTLPFKTDLKSELLLPSPVFAIFHKSCIRCQNGKPNLLFPCAKLGKLAKAKRSVVKRKKRFSFIQRRQIVDLTKGEKCVHSCWMWVKFKMRTSKGGVALTGPAELKQTNFQWQSKSHPVAVG